LESGVDLGENLGEFVPFKTYTLVVRVSPPNGAFKGGDLLTRGAKLSEQVETGPPRPAHAVDSDFAATVVIASISTCRC
jgi:hypothetical protein